MLLHQRHKEARTCHLVALLLGVSLRRTATPRVLLRTRTPTLDLATVSSLSLDLEQVYKDQGVSRGVSVFLAPAVHNREG